MGGRPISYKYREGKMKRTLKRESEELEVVESNAIVTSNGELVIQYGGGCSLLSLRADSSATYQSSG